MSSLEDDLRLASTALDQGDLKHAAHHLAGAVAAAPVHPRVTALVERFAAEGDAALDAVPLVEGVYQGTVALHALLLHRRGQTPEAVSLLWQCLGAVPDADYLSCIEACLGPAGAVPGADGETLVGSALGVFDQLPRRVQARTADLLLRIAHDLPEDDWAFYAACIAVRKSGRVKDAAALGTARVQARPSYWAYVALAGAKREAGDDEGALEAYRSAARLAPDNPSCLLDCGDLLVELKRPAEALAAYEEALAGAPGHPWAYPSALFLRARAGDGSAREELLRMAHAPDAPPRAHDLATDLAPFDFELPRRQDACLKLVDSQGKNKVVAVASSSLEAPSAYRVLRLLSGPELEISAHVPQPDPRVPRGRVSFVLWRYGRTGWRRLLGGGLPLEAHPAVAPPWPDAAEAIAALAREPYSREIWWQRAGRIVGLLRERARPTALASMVHWPPPPVGEQLADAAFRVQVASAYVLARGAQRDALETILRGPVDWVGAAALVGLTELAARGDRLARDLLLETALDDEVNPTRWQCLIEPALRLAALLPGLEPETAERLAARLKEAEE